MNPCSTELMSTTKAKQWTVRLTAHRPSLSTGVMHQEFSLLHQTSTSFTSFSLTQRQGRRAEIQIDRLADLSSHQRARNKDRWLVRQADTQAVLDSKKNWKMQRKTSRGRAGLTDRALPFSHLRLALLSHKYLLHIYKKLFSSACKMFAGNYTHYLFSKAFKSWIINIGIIRSRIRS